MCVCVCVCLDLHCLGYVCNWVAGAWRGREGSPFTGEVFPEHPGTVPGYDARAHVNNALVARPLAECVVVSPHRYGVNHRMALVWSISSQEWEDSCRLCCLVTPASGQLIFLS